MTSPYKCLVLCGILCGSIRMVVVAQEVANSPDCREQVLIGCSTQLVHLMPNNKDYNLATNMTQLRKTCIEMSKALACVDNILNECAKGNKDVVDNIFAGMKAHLGALCDEGSDYQKDYLRHAKCLAEAETKVESCVNESYQVPIDDILISKLPDKESTQSHEQDVDMLCCVVKKLMVCSDTHYTADCGSEAADFSRKGLLRMLGSPLIETCTGSNGEIKCSAMSSAAAAAAAAAAGTASRDVYRQLTVIVMMAVTLFQHAYS